MDSATIFADGSVRIDGYVPQKWRLLAINDDLIVIHSPGGHWWDNGGKHYGAASVFTKQIEDLKPGNEPGTWRVKFKRLSPFAISYHPTPKEAVKEAVLHLQNYGERMAARIAAK